MSICELCKAQATTFCESDQASLCWDCDAKVHGANFLVARHIRTLLCRSCQSPTPWRASGAKLGNTFSFCQTCNDRLKGEESQTANDDDGVTDDEDSVDSDARRNDVFSDKEDDDVDGVEEDGDNQVVPFSINSPPPPPASSSSSDESVNKSSDSDGDFSDSGSVFSLKRMRGKASDLLLQDDRSLSMRYGSESMNEVTGESRSGGEATCLESWRPSKVRRSGAGRSSFKYPRRKLKMVENFKEGERTSDNLDEETEAV